MDTKSDFFYSLFNLDSRLTERLRMARIVVPVIVAVLAGLVSVISCNSAQPVEEELQAVLAKETIKAKLDPDCLGRSDTIFPNNDYLKYVALGDSAYDLSVRIGNIEAMLGFSFTCNVPRGLVPKILEHRHSQIVLIRGAGQHFREVLVCSQTDGSIVINRFEAEVAMGAKYDAAYFDSNDSAIIVIDLLNKKSIKLPMPYSNVRSVNRFEISKDSIVIVDNNEQRLAISL